MMLESKSEHIISHINQMVQNMDTFVRDEKERKKKATLVLQIIVVETSKKN